jgi:hypothetical protein
VAAILEDVMQPDEDEARPYAREPGDSPANAADVRGASERDASHDQRRIGATAAPGADRVSTARRGDGAQRVAPVEPTVGADREAKHADGLRAAVLVFARSRLAPLSAEDAAALTALTDEGELTELVDTLAHAASVEDARAVLAAAIAGIRK